MPTVTRSETAPISIRLKSNGQNFNATELTALVLKVPHKNGGELSISTYSTVDASEGSFTVNPSSSEAGNYKIGRDQDMIVKVTLASKDYYFHGKRQWHVESDKVYE